MRVFLYLWCLFVVCACSASPEEELILVPPGDSTSNQEKEEPSLDVNNLSLEELKKIANVYTFEDIKAMDEWEVFSVFAPPPYRIKNPVVLLKDFKNWKLEELDNGAIVSVIHGFSLHHHNISEKGISQKVYIDDNDERIYDVTFEQLKASALKVGAGRFCFGNERPNYYPVEYITKLSSRELVAFDSCLTKEQLMALSDEQIMKTGIYRTYDNVVPFSPEKVKVFWPHILEFRRIWWSPCNVFRALNKEQVQFLDPEQIRSSRPRPFNVGGVSRLRGTWCWNPEQWSWFTPDQLKVISFTEEVNEYAYGHFDYISKPIVEHLSDDQLRVFSKEQIEGLLFREIRYFSPHQLRVLKENGTANKFMEKAIELQDLGPRIFDEYPENLDICYVGDDFKRDRCDILLKYLALLTPDQFSSIGMFQARSLDFEEVFRLTGEQISYFPDFVKILNFSDDTFDVPFIYPKLYDAYDKVAPARFGMIDGIYSVLPFSQEEEYQKEQAKRQLERKYLKVYDTLNHARLLGRSQIRGITPDQIKDIPLVAFDILYKREYAGYPSREGDKSDEYKISLTPEQFAGMSDEQFARIFHGVSLQISEPIYSIDGTQLAPGIFSHATLWEEEVSYLKDEHLEALSLERLDSFIEKLNVRLRGRIKPISSYKHLIPLEHQALSLTDLNFINKEIRGFVSLRDKLLKIRKKL